MGNMCGGGQTTPPQVQKILDTRVAPNQQLAQFFMDRLAQGGGSTQQFPRNLTAPNSPLLNAFYQNVQPAISGQLAGTGIQVPGPITPGNIPLLGMGSYGGGTTGLMGGGGGGCPGGGNFMSSMNMYGPSGQYDWTSWNNPFSGSLPWGPFQNPQDYGTPVFRQGVDPEEDVTYTPGKNLPGAGAPPKRGREGRR